MPLGNSPISEKLILTAGADFVHRINAPAGEEIPIGTAAFIAIYPSQDTDAVADTLWPATTVTGGYIAWRVEAEDADEIADGAYFRLYVTYDDTPTLEHCWYRGTVKRMQ